MIATFELTASGAVDHHMLDAMIPSAHDAMLTKSRPHTHESTENAQ